jgi:AbrB family looped-hinge helix DNA binding protein
MLVELRARSQITIPAEIIKKLGATEGDMFEVIERDGGIFLCPVVVYPKAEMERIAYLIREAKEQSSELKAYDDVSKMLADMGIEINDV